LLERLPFTITIAPTLPADIAARLLSRLEPRQEPAAKSPFVVS